MLTYDDDEDDGELEDDDDLSEDVDDDDDDVSSSDTSPCPYCHKQIYADADVCPYCGNFVALADLKSRKPIWIIVGVILCVIAVVFILLR